MHIERPKGRTLDKVGHMMGVVRDANEPDDAYRHRIYIAGKCMYSRSPLESLINDISNIGALVVDVKDMPHMSFRITVVGGKRNDIAQCIHDARFAGAKSIGNTSGIALNEFGDASTEWFNHIETDYMMCAIDFMEKWQPVVYDIKEVIEELD